MDSFHQVYSLLSLNPAGVHCHLPAGVLLFRFGRFASSTSTLNHKRFKFILFLKEKWRLMGEVPRGERWKHEAEKAFAEG